MTLPISIDAEFEQLIPPLSDEERGQLETSLKTEGCRDALVCWRHADTLTLVDGHNRYALCKQHGIEYRIIEREFDSREDVIIWIVNNQLARRNLTAYARAELALKQKAAFAVKAKANMAAGGKGLPNLATLNVREEVSKIAEVGHETIRKVEIVGLSAFEGIKRKARDGELSVDRAFKLTRELQGASAMVVDAVTKHDIDDLDTVRVLKALKPDSDTLREIVNSGFIQPGDETEAVSVTAGALALKAALQQKSDIHRLIAFDKRQAERETLAHSLSGNTYNVFYADPPWQYDNTGVHGAAEDHYDTMPTPDICALLRKLEVCAAKDSVLFLWATNPTLTDAFKVVEAWGFTYKTNMVWVKTDLVKPGSGFYVRGRHELLLIATRGSFTPLDKHISPPIGSVVSASIQEHSRKPDDFYTIIERLYPGCRYLELFARRQREGWTAWGDQANG